MGTYRGVKFVRRRLCDALYASRLRSYWYWVLDADGSPTGDHFRTQREMRQWIDLRQPEPFSQYVHCNWGNISRDERGWYILADASRTLKMLRHDGWIAKVIDSQLQPDDTVRVYLEVEGADDAMPGHTDPQPSGNSRQFT